MELWKYNKNEFFSVKRMENFRLILSLSWLGVNENLFCKKWPIYIYFQPSSFLQRSFHHTFVCVLFTMVILSVFGNNIRLIVILLWQVEVKKLFSEKWSTYVSVQQSSSVQKSFCPFLVYRFFSLAILSIFVTKVDWQ